MLRRTLRGAFPGTYAVCFVHQENHLVTNLDGFDEAIGVRQRDLPSRRPVRAQFRPRCRSRESDETAGGPDAG